MFRYYGMMERSISVLVLYFLISKHFSPMATFIAVVSSAFFIKALILMFFILISDNSIILFIVIDLSTVWDRFAICRGCMIVLLVYLHPCVFY